MKVLLLFEALFSQALADLAYANGYGNNSELRGILLVFRYTRRPRPML
jgi:hypothetical protein